MKEAGSRSESVWKELEAEAIFFKSGASGFSNWLELLELIGFNCICSSINNAFNSILILIPTSMYGNERSKQNDDNRSGDSGELIDGSIDFRMQTQ